jgi:PAS domain-containing protein
MHYSTGFGNLLKAMLRLRGVSPADLSTTIHVDPSLVRKWIAGSRVPSLRSDYYNRICTHLQLNDSEKDLLRKSQIYSLDPKGALQAAETRAHEYEMLLSVLFKNSKDPIFLVSPADGSILSANPAACRMGQVNEENFASLGTRIRVLPENMPFSNFLLQLLNQKKSNASTKLCIPNAIILPADISLQLCESSAAASIALCLLQEITEPNILERINVLSQNRAILAEQRLDAFMSCMADGFFVVDDNWIITFANRALLSNPLAHDFVGKNILDDFPRVEVFYQHLMNVRTNRVSARCTDFVPLANSWIELNIHPMPDGGMAVYVRKLPAPS